MGEGKGSRAETEENDVSSSPKEDRGGAAGKVGEGEERGIRIGEAGAVMPAALVLTIQSQTSLALHLLHPDMGAEEFSYNLKNLKRATIISETTGGGAHPVDGHRIDDHFMIGVPLARAINPISKTNWEGTGVEPDVKVPAAEVLTTAQKLVSEKLSAK